MSKFFQAFTVTSNPEHPGCRRLVASAKRWGWDLMVLVFTEGWERNTFAAENRGQLEVLRMQEPDFFLYLDAWDTIFTGPPQELVYLLKPGRLTFSGCMVGIDAWTNHPQAVKHARDCFPPAGSDDFRYANSGVMWGDSAILRELNEDYLANYFPQTVVNQDYVNWRYAMERSLRRERLWVDTKAVTAITAIMPKRTGLQLDDVGRLWYSFNHTRPVIFHRAGMSGSPTLAAPMPFGLDAFYGLKPEEIQSAK